MASPTACWTGPAATRCHWRCSMRRGGTSPCAGWCITPVPAGGMAAAELARVFPSTDLSATSDGVADGLLDWASSDPLPLALFDAARVDFSLRRLVHYTGTDWRHVQPWILLTNYHRYVDQFIRH